MSALFALAFLATPAAALTLTPSAVCRGFTLTTYASNIPHGTAIGPLGIAYLPNGQVLVTSFDPGHTGSTIYRLPDHAGPYVYPAGFSVATTYPFGDAICFAQVKLANVWHYYLGQQIAGKIIEVDQNGVELPTGNPIATMNRPTGMAIYPPSLPSSPFKNHMFVDDADGNIWNVNLVAKTKTLVTTTTGDPDGISFSPDGSVFYVACVAENVIRGFDTVTGAKIWESCAFPGGPDGTSIGLGVLDGYLYVNYNNGEVWELGLPATAHEGEATRIATGGSRGDFIAADPNAPCPGGYPSLLLTQTDEVLRLDPPGGGFFGPPTSGTDNVQVAVIPDTRVDVGKGLKAYPNPFLEDTRVRFTLPHAGRLDVQVFDAAGRSIRQLASGVRPAGEHELEWDGFSSNGNSVDAGLYFIRVRFEDQEIVSHVVRIK